MKYLKCYVFNCSLLGFAISFSRDGCVHTIILPSVHLLCVLKVEFQDAMFFIFELIIVVGFFWNESFLSYIEICKQDTREDDATGKGLVEVSINR